MKIGIVGYGAIASTHKNCVEQLGYKVSAICDSKLIDVDNYFSTYDELLLSDIECVHILTPHHLHVEMAIKALYAGKNVVLEKPFGTNFNELNQLKDAVEKGAGKLGVIFQNRFNICVQRMKTMIASNKLGKFKGSRAILSWHRDERYYENSWRGKKITEGGGLLINQAIHTFDLLRYLVGEYENFKGALLNLNHPKNDVEDTAIVEFEFTNGEKGSFFGTLNHPVNAGIIVELVFDKGILRYDDGELFFNGHFIVSDSRNNTKSYWGNGHLKNIENIYGYFKGETKLDIEFSDAVKTNEKILEIYEVLND